MSSGWHRRSAGAVCVAVVVAAIAGCKPADVPKVGFKVAEETVRASPEVAAAALKAAQSAPRYAQGVQAHPQQPVAAVPPVGYSSSGSAPGYYPQPGYPQAGYAQPGYAQPGYPPPAYPQPGHPQPAYAPPDPAAAGVCTPHGAAPDGRPVVLCNGYPWVQDRRSAEWVLYTPDQAAPLR